VKPAVGDDRVARVDPLAAAQVGESPARLFNDHLCRGVVPRVAAAAQGDVSQSCGDGEEAVALIGPHGRGALRDGRERAGMAITPTLMSAPRPSATKVIQPGTQLLPRLMEPGQLLGRC
jgi:hypothetical protein